jgi:hypothetical protein
VTADRFQAVAGTIDTFSATTNVFSTTITVANVGEIPYVPSPFRTEAEQSILANRLAKLDPVLGNVYHQIWEVLYTTRSEPERTALYQMRQAFDHLFSCLSPDDAVRASQYWKQKEGDKLNQIDRRERIEYAAFTHVKDESHARTLAASADQMLEVYQALNQAHKRGELSPDKARQALFAMQSFFYDWADALEL